tara:strand:- start:1229 stop:1531 length:303 start_codon:yes stop_codon:yes gene_type:complete
MKILTLCVLSIFSFNAHAINLSGNEKLACEYALCVPIGLLISESRDKCLRVERRWKLYVATLGPFKSPPKCPLINANGDKVGTVDDVCQGNEECKKTKNN